MIQAPISIGELFDKISILEIKARNFTGEKLVNVQKELKLLRTLVPPLESNDAKIEVATLAFINNKLWDIEEQIRDYVAKDMVDSSFIMIKEIHEKNAWRASTKKRLNEIYQSGITEEKDYETTKG